ncbi:MAG: DEAD/DEAH box helicase [Nanoarchaeota archaeon]
MTLLNLTPREYQQKIFETAKNSNTLVILPTGLGKTLIALLLSIERKKAFPLSKILFLAPTRPLIEQHFEYFKKNLPELFAEMELFTGQIEAPKRKKIWQTAEIIFSTPQCIANDLENSLYNLNEVSLLIIDEAHRCLKNYDYTNVVRKYKEHSQIQRILGLTASPGQDPLKVREICKHLDIEEIELRTRDSEDVKPYLQKLEFKKVEVPFPQEFIEIRVLLKRLFDEKADKIKKMFPNLTPVNKITLLKLQSSLASQMAGKNFHAMIGMSLTAQAIKLSHALELLETQTLSGLDSYLRGLVQQAKEKKTKGVQTLVNSPDFQASLLSLKRLLDNKIEHPKIEEASVIIENELKENKNAKIIIFTQFRDTASIILSRLKKIPEARAEIFIGQAKKKNLGLSQKEQKQVIEKFKSGETNILCATSIGEEGLDIPEVNAVIFYEPIPSAIRKIQRTGRTARLSSGKLFILVTNDTRDVIHHYASSAREKKMHKTIDLIKKEMKEKKKTSTAESLLSRLELLDKFSKSY